MTCNKQIFEAFWSIVTENNSVNLDLEKFPKQTIKYPKNRQTLMGKTFQLFTKLRAVKNAAHFTVDSRGTYLKYMHRSK